MLNPRNEVFERSAAYFGKVFQEASGLPVSTGEGPGNIAIFISDTETLDLVKRMDVNDISNYLERFIKSGIPCSGRVYSSDGEILHVNIAINPQLSSPEIHSCFYEELYNSSGLFGDPIDDSSLFDSYPLSQNKAGEWEFPTELIAMMKVYYSISPRHFEMKRDLELAVQKMCPPEN